VELKIELKPTKPMTVAVVVIIVIIAAGFVGTLIPSQRLGAVEESQYYDASSLIEAVPPVVTATSAGGTMTKAGEAEPLAYPTPSERMAIRTGTISIEVSDAERSVEEITRLSESTGGYTSGSHLSVYEGRMTGWISIRVPQNMFAKVLEEVKKLGDVQDVFTSSEDITEQYIDIQARLKNLEAHETVLRELLERSVSVEDTLEVQRELQRVRGEIESLAGRLNYLKGNVEFSLITVNVSEPRLSSPVEPPMADWGETFTTALFTLYSVARGLIIIIFAFLPFIIVGVPIIAIWRWRIKKRSSSRTPQHPT